MRLSPIPVFPANRFHEDQRIGGPSQGLEIQSGFREDQRIRDPSQGLETQSGFREDQRIRDPSQGLTLDHDEDQRIRDPLPGLILREDSSHEELDSTSIHVPQRNLLLNKARNMEDVKPVVIGLATEEKLINSSTCLLYPGFLSSEESATSMEVILTGDNDSVCNKRTSAQFSLESMKSLCIRFRPKQLVNNVLEEEEACFDNRSNESKTNDLLSGDEASSTMVCDGSEDFDTDKEEYSKAGISMDNYNKKTMDISREDAGLWRQLTFWLVWFAGLIIHALGVQVKVMFRVFLGSMLVGYHVFLFSLNPFTYVVQAKLKASKAQNKMICEKEKLGLKIKDKVFSLQPTIAIGAQRLAIGCLTATYTVLVLTFLFISAFALGFLIVKGFVHEPVQLHRHLYFDYTSPLPVALADFSSPNIYPESDGILTRISFPRRSFRATVLLTLPESDFNKELGIFQVTAEILSATGQVIFRSAQPCMLRFHSHVLQLAKSVLMAMPVLTGFYSETQTLAVTLLEWEEQRPVTFAAVRVMLAPRAERSLIKGLPELYGAEIHLSSELPWWLSLVGCWRWTFSVWMGATLFVGALVLILCFCKPVLVPDMGVVLSLFTHGLKGSRKVDAKCLEGEMPASKSAFKGIANHGPSENSGVMDNS